MGVAGRAPGPVNLGLAPLVIPRKTSLCWKKFSYAPRRLQALSPECKEAGLTPYFNTGLRLMAPGDLINSDLKGILP